jgi:hypothetical protein
MAATPYRYSITNDNHYHMMNANEKWRFLQGAGGAERYCV